MAANQESLGKATALRQNRLAEFNAEEKDLLESILALKEAIVVLSKHHGGALVQLTCSHRLGAAATLQVQLSKPHLCFRVC